MSKAINKTELTEKVIKEAREYFPENVLAFVDECMKGQHPSGQLIAVLHKVQSHFGYVSEKSIQNVAILMNVPAAKVSGVISFYHLFHTEPQGKYVISVCTGTACYVKGAYKLVDRLQEELGIKNKETTTDGLFTLEEARCLGTCALAPVIKVNDKVHSKVTPDQIPAILESYGAAAKK